MTDHSDRLWAEDVDRPWAKDIPTKEDITKFLEVFNALDKFEATICHVRNQIRVYSPWNDIDCPNPKVIKVIEWLEKISKE
jgi:hypothetical protein